MDYLRRLLLRSLAVAREHGTPVFDPFAQVAGWEFDATRPAPHENAADAADGIVPPPVTLPGDTEAAPSHPALSPPVHATARRAPDAIDAPVAFQQSSHPPDTQALPAPKDNAAAADPERVLLTQADAFMRSLGMKSVVATEESRARQGAEMPASVPTPNSPQASAPTPRANGAESPVLVRPEIPRAIEHPRLQANPRRRPDPAAAPTPSRAAAAPSAPPLAAPGERVVRTTVIVASNARGLDDLAHSSGISRFGIGQG